MAVKIPIVTVFDSKGLRQAQYQLGKVDKNIGNLKRNFAIAGAALAGAFVAIGKAVSDAAESQKVFAQTEAVLKSTGTTANGTAKDIQNLAQSLQKSTAFNDEAILSGQNLLLTFKNVQNQAGAGNDIFNQTSQLMLDVARAMGTDASGEAIRLGKALNDPVKGISALTRVGIQFTDQQKAQIKALTESGDLMGAQKIILAELQSQFGGSAAAYAGTFAGQVESLNNELGDMSEEIGFMVMPAIQDLVTELRDLIPVIGPQIRDAIKAVDWKGLVTTLMDAVKWFAENARTIGLVVGAMFALNTAYNVGRVAVGLYNAAAVILNTTMGKAITSARLLRGALLLTGVVAAVGAVITEYQRAKKAIDDAVPQASSFNKEVYAAASAAGEVSPMTKIFVKITNAILGATGKTIDYKNETKNISRIGFGSHQSSINQIERAWKNAKAAADRYDASAAGKGVNTSTLAGILDASGSGVYTPPTIDTGTSGAAASVKKQTASLTATLKKEATIAKKEAKLLGSGISQGLADKILSSNTPIKQANKILNKIANTGGKAATKLQNQFNQTKAGQAELAQQAAQQQAIMDQMAAEAAAAAEQAAYQAQQYADQIAEQQREAFEQAQEQARLVAEAAAEQAREMQRIQEEAARAEEEALKERERIYNSFLDSVKNTFGQIKDSILNSFDLTQLGGSTDSIIRNMKKLLTTTRAFATNITKLSSMGLDPTLLAQVIQAGPVAGSRLAAALVSGGAAALNEINAGYQAYSGLAGDIATTGVNSRFGTAQQQTIYNINVNGGVGSGATIGKSIVDAIKAYERSSGAVWVGA